MFLGCYQADLPVITEIEPDEIDIGEVVDHRVEIAIYGNGFSDYIINDRPSSDTPRSDRYFYIRLVDQDGKVDRYLENRFGDISLSWSPEQVHKIRAWLDLEDPYPIAAGEYLIEVVLPGMRLLESPITLTLTRPEDDTQPPSDAGTDEDSGPTPDPLVCIELGKRDIFGVEGPVHDLDIGIEFPPCQEPNLDCGFAVYRFDVDVEGDYYLWGLVGLLASIIFSPSFYVMMDVEEPFIWDIFQCDYPVVVVQGLSWNEVSRRPLDTHGCYSDMLEPQAVFHLHEGTHFLTIWGRSGDLMFSKFVLMNEPDAFPVEYVFDVCKVL